jgi:hypothetical protein
VYRIGQEKDVHVYYPMCTIPGEPYPSFDQILDDLLERKRALADASLFPSERAEVKPDDLYSSVLDEDEGGEAEPTSSIDLETAVSLDPYLFEALVAHLWKKEGCHVHLTPRQSDRGADVVAQEGDRGILIQVKQQDRTVGTSPVREVYSSRPFYEREFGTSFDDLIVVTSASRYTQGAREMGRDTGVTLLNRTDLAKRIERHEPMLKHIHQQERTRMETL